jgi:phosphonate degradation associated HDIG domain protein
MNAKQTPEDTVKEIFSLYEQLGHADYIGEPVSQLEHMSQAAQRAMNSGCDDEVVLAAFFHDIGHLCVSKGKDNDMEGLGIRDHEDVGAEFLRKRGFSQRLIQLVRNHVLAKRYLTAVDSTYYSRLSPASRRTLELQGGPMTSREVRAFERDPTFPVSLKLRRWDDEAKIPHQPVDNLGQLRSMAYRVLLSGLNKR